MILLYLSPSKITSIASTGFIFSASKSSAPNNSSLSNALNTVGEYPLTEIPSANNNKISLRIAFKKHQLEEALLYSKELINKGYEVSINPMHTSTYNRSEWEYLIESVNKVSPKVFTIVDTNGAMREYEIISYYNILDKLLDKDISIGFHSHNNMQLSLANAKCLLDICKIESAQRLPLSGVNVLEIRYNFDTNCYFHRFLLKFTKKCTLCLQYTPGTNACQ